MTDALTLADERCKEYADLATNERRSRGEKPVFPLNRSSFHNFCGRFIFGKVGTINRFGRRFTPCFPSIIAFVAIV
jgi:hypothetical protein